MVSGIAPVYIVLQGNPTTVRLRIHFHLEVIIYAEASLRNKLEGQTLLEWPPNCVQQTEFVEAIAVA